MVYPNSRRLRAKGMHQGASRYVTGDIHGGTSGEAVG
jgi:hypothetical protein